MHQSQTYRTGSLAVALLGSIRSMNAIRQQIRFCRAHDGTQLAVGTVGKGPPLLHAGHWLSHIKRDARSPVWIPWLRELSQSHTYIRYDQRGCGLSESASTPASLETWTKDLETVADTLGLKRFALLAMSQGGAPAIAYAASHPDRVSHLVLLGAYAQGRLRRDPHPLQHEEAAVLLDVMRIGSQGDSRAFREIFTMLFIPDGTREQHQWFNDLGPVATLADGAVAMREVFYQLDVTALAKTVRVPSLILHARQDAVVPFEQGRRLAALIPSARFVPLDSRNHVLLETEPAWTQFLAELRSFLADGMGSAGQLDRLPGAEQLTPAELQVLTLLARGLQDAAIAARLDKGEKTVRNQVSSILGKLGASTRAEAVALARDAGIGEPGGNAASAP